MSSSSHSELPPVVLLVGNETTLRDAALAQLRERALGSGPRDFNEDRFDLATAGTDPTAVLMACRTLPVMSERRLVIVTGLAEKRAAAFLTDHLLAYLEDPVPTTVLALDASRVDRRQKWVKRVASVGELRDCSGPSKRPEVCAWIEARIRTAGKKPGRGAVAALFELIGADLSRLAFEIEKARLYVGAADEITAEDVATVSASLRPLAVYELCDAIGERRAAEALRVLARLRDQGDAPLMVLGTLANHFRRLLRAHDCRLEPKSVQQTLAIHPFVARKLAEQARRFEPRRLRRCLEMARRSDEAVKGAISLPPAMVLEQLVLSVCS